MMDLNNLFIAKSIGLDISTEIEDSILATTIADLSADLLEPDTDPDSFIMLMTQLQNNPVVLNEISTSGEETSTDDVNTAAPMLAAAPDVFLTDDDPSHSDAIQAPEQNIALTWINSESYQPPKTLNSMVEDTSSENQFSVNGIAKGVLMPAEEEAIDFIKAEDKEPPANSILKEILGFDSAISTNSNATKSILPNESIQIKPDTDNLAATLPTALGTITPQSSFNNTTALEKPLSISVDIAHPEWTNQFAEHIVWLGQQGIKGALIKIHPEELGPIEITIKMAKEVASLNISSHSGQVCQIIDQSLPKLRDMMAEQGINLSDVQIDLNQNSQQFSDNNQQNDEHKLESATEDKQLITSIVRKPSQGLVDYFA